MARPAIVAYHLDGAVFGGVETNLGHILANLDRARFDPVVLCREVPELVDAVTRLGARVVVLPVVARKTNVTAWWQVIGSMRRVAPDVLHVMQSHSFSGEYALLASRLSRTRAVVVTAHFPSPPADRLQATLRRLLMTGVDLQLAASRYAASELHRLGQGHPTPEVAPNGIEPVEPLSRQQARAALGLAPEAIVVGAAMRLEKWKRVDLLIDVARRLAEVTVVILGDGPERASLERDAGSTVRFAGYRPSAPRLFSAFDVFVHPTPTEPQGLVVLEAMAAGVPVVVANTGGAAELVDHERSGLLAPANGEALAAGVTRLLAEPAMATSLAAAGQAEARTHYSAGAMTTRLEQAYAQLLARGG